MSSSNATLPIELKGFMRRIIAVEFRIREENGTRSFDTIVLAANIYTGLLDWVLESCKTVENYRQLSLGIRQLNGDVKQSGNVASTLPSAQWMASFSARSEPDDTPHPDELQAYMNQVIEVMDEEIQLRVKYKNTNFPTREIKSLKDVFDLVIKKLNMLGRLKWINGGTPAMTQLMTNVVTMISGPGVNVNDLVPPYKTQEDAMEHANQMIDKIMAEDANK
jgi:hypothetical protein